MASRVSFASALAVLLVWSPLFAAPGVGDLWTDDFEAAKARAKEQGKDLLIDFTGSDWCGWCFRLRDEVFVKPRFIAEAPKGFVLVELDYPQRKKLKPEIVERNAKLKAQFHVSGYPTIALADADGRVYAKTGYQQGGEDRYLDHLAELRKIKSWRDNALAEAQKLSGIDKAKSLDAIITRLGNARVVPMDNPDWVAQILQLDADGKAGLKAKYEILQQLDVAERLMGEGQFAQAIASVNKTIVDLKPTGDALQEACYVKGMCQHRSGDAKGAIASFETGLKASPNGPKSRHLTQYIQVLGKSKGRD